MITCTRTGTALGLSVALIAWAVAPAARADAPPFIAYQGLLTLRDGTVAPDAIYALRVSLWDQPAGGTRKFTQTLSVSVQAGLYHVILSDPGLVSAVGTGAEPRYAQVEILSGGAVTSPVTLLPRQRLGSVPYSLNAPKVDPLFVGVGGTCDATTEGTLRYRTGADPETRAIEFCDGVEWRPLGG